MGPHNRFVLLLIVLSSSYLQAQDPVHVADNGITASGSSTTRKVSLGGALTNNTTINFANFNLLFDGTGNIGIRTTMPFAPLHVTKNVSGNFNPVAIFEDALSNGYTMIQLRGTNRRFHLGVGNQNETALGLAGKFFIWDNDAEAARLVVNTTGQVGIGTNSPGSLLDVNGASRFRNNLTADFGTTNRRAQLRDNGLFMSRTSDGQYLSSIVADGNMDLNTRNHYRFFSDGVEIVSMNNGGNVGIGVVSPSTKLHVNGATTVNGDISITNTAPHVVTTRHPILLGDESGAAYLFHGNTAGLPIYFGAGNGNNFRKFYFQRQEQTGDDLAAYNFVYNSASAPALQVFNFAQGITKMLVTSGGNLVINNGTTDINSNYKLQVTGTTYTTGLVIPTGAAAGKVLTSDANGIATWEPATGSANAWVYGGNNVGGASQIGNSSNQTLEIITNNLSRISVAATGEVGIGTSSVDPAYKLSVQGSIRARKVRVDAAAWPDYVFQPTYTLRPLSEVEAYIKNNSHLPEVPSAEEVTKEGIDLGENQAVLLKKIEELTLYIIEQNKRLEAVEKELKQLKKK